MYCPQLVHRFETYRKQVEGLPSNEYLLGRWFAQTYAHGTCIVELFS